MCSYTLRMYVCILSWNVKLGMKRLTRSYKFLITIKTNENEKKQSVVIFLKIFFLFRGKFRSIWTFVCGWIWTFAWQRNLFQINKNSWYYKTESIFLSVLKGFSYHYLHEMHVILHLITNSDHRWSIGCTEHKETNTYRVHLGQRRIIEVYL